MWRFSFWTKMICRKLITSIRICELRKYVERFPVFSVRCANNAPFTALALQEQLTSNVRRVSIALAEGTESFVQRHFNHWRLEGTGPLETPQLAGQLNQNYRTFEFEFSFGISEFGRQQHRQRFGYFVPERAKGVLSSSERVDRVPLQLISILGIVSAWKSHQSSASMWSLSAHLSGNTDLGAQPCNRFEWDLHLERPN